MINGGVSNEKLNNIKFCLQQIKHPLEGAIIEFGVYEGYSLSEMVLFCRNNEIDRKFYGFDTFEGMPESQHIWSKGDACSSYENTQSELLKKLGVVDNITLVKGNFKQSLTKELQSLIAKAAFIHVDCDLYSSTVDVLSFCKPLIQEGTFIVFDEFFDEIGGPYEGRAWAEFIRDTGLTFESLGGEKEQRCFRIKTVNRVSKLK